MTENNEREKCVNNILILTENERNSMYENKEEEKAEIRSQYSIFSWAMSSISEMILVAISYVYYIRINLDDKISYQHQRRLNFPSIKSIEISVDICLMCTSDKPLCVCVRASVDVEHFSN